MTAGESDIMFIGAYQFLVFPECALTGYPPRDMEKASSVDFGTLASVITKGLSDWLTAGGAS